ncbi:MAG: alpha/beta fold hydrolase [Pseudomonadota bacterium]|nr:alpha/beta fold hydrolase [Pseudomonadota bacterium]
MLNDINRSQFLPGGDYAVLALHGLRSTPLELQPLLQALHRAGFTVDAPHLKGYGFSAKASTGCWRDWLDEIVARFDTLAAQYSRVAICGLSMGATLALAAAAERSGAVAAVGALSTTLYYDGWNTPWYRFLSPIGYFTPLRYRMVIRETSPFGIKNERLREWIERQVAAGPISAVGASALSLPALHEAEKLMRYTRRNLQQVDAPTLILHSSEDDISSLKSAYLVQSRVQAHDVRLVQLHDSYHMITLDNERERVAALTVDFFLSHGDTMQSFSPPIHVQDMTERIKQ